MRQSAEWNATDCCGDHDICEGEGGRRRPIGSTDGSHLMSLTMMMASRAATMDESRLACRNERRWQHRTDVDGIQPKPHRPHRLVRHGVRMVLGAAYVSNRRTRRP
jgi:hypothetical protein